MELLDIEISESDRLRLSTILGSRKKRRLFRLDVAANCSIDNPQWKARNAV